MGVNARSNSRELKVIAFAERDQGLNGVREADPLFRVSLAF